MLKGWQRNLYKFVKYGVVGISAAVVDYSFFSLILVLLSYISEQGSFSFFFFDALIVANLSGVVAGFLWSFVLQRVWAFRSKGNVAKQAVATLALLGANLVLSSALIKLLVESGDLSAWWAKFATQCVVVVWNFLIYNYLIFRERKNDE